MKSAILLSLTCLVACVAAAPYNNEQSVLEGGDLEGCNVQRCDSSCKDDGHVAGVCTFAGCTCLESDLTTIEVLSEILRDDPAEGNVLITEDCPKTFQKICEKHCRDTYHKGAICKDGRCQCIDGGQTEEPSSEEVGHDDLVNDTRVCVPGLRRACDVACRKIGKKGDCQDGRCRCARRTGVQADESPSLEFDKDDSVVNNRVCVPGLQRACDVACRRIGKKSDCRDGRCQCVRRTSTQADDDLSKLCNLPSGNTMCLLGCKYEGKGSGYCLNGKCVCDSDRNPSVDVSQVEVTENKIEKQNINTGDKCTRREENQCNSWCKSGGHAYGVCTFAGCTCIDGKDTTTESHTLQSGEPEKCIDAECNIFCILTDHGTGRCVNERCKCSRGGPLYKLEAPGQCSPERCDRSCHKFPGECVNGRCVCG